jgi:hypothetical protein
VKVIETPADSPEWTSFVTRSFYLRSRGGQHYGRLVLDITADYEPTPTMMTLAAFVNPRGSRNLEYDDRKEIGAEDRVK